MSDAGKPGHIAIIMDGNGRWARRRNLPRVAGHKQGAEAVRRVVETCAEMQIPYLTLFGFSTENWSRPEEEINELMSLLRHYLRGEIAELHKNNIRLRVIGDRSAFDEDIVRMIEHAERMTAGNDRLTVVMALNYGGRLDILSAARRFGETVLEEGRAALDRLDEGAFSSFLMTGDLPDPDLLIRTSGEQRISNFLLWQCAYAEFVFTETLWPDFSKKDFHDALLRFSERERRYGALKAGGESCVQ